MRLNLVSTLALCGLTYAGLMHAHGPDARTRAGLGKSVRGGACNKEQVDKSVSVAREQFLDDVKSSQTIRSLIPFKKATLDILKKNQCVNIHATMDGFAQAFADDKNALGESMTVEEAKAFIVASGSTGFTAGADNSIHILVSDPQAEQQNHDLVHEVMHVMSAPAGITNFKMFQSDNINEAFNDYFARIVLNEEKIDTLVRYPYLFIFGKLVAKAIGPENLAPYFFRDDKDTDFFKDVIVDALVKIAREKNEKSVSLTNPFKAKDTYKKSFDTMYKKIQSTIGELVIDRNQMRPNLHPFIVESFFKWFITYQVFDAETYKEAIDHLDVQLQQR